LSNSPPAQAFDPPRKPLSGQISPAAPAGTAAPPDTQWWIDVQDPIRRAGFYFTLAFIFLRFSGIHEILAYQFGIRTYLAYITGVPALLALIACGGLRRSMRHRPIHYWLGFGLWLALAVPFSTWRGGSLEAVVDYWRTELCMLFLISGLVMTWEEVRKLMYAVALSGLVNLAAARLFGRTQEDRLQLEFGTMANANDFAAQLLLIVPFLLFVLFTKRSLLLRGLMLAAVIYAMFLAASTGSRGALVTMLVFALFFFVRGSRVQRILLGTLAPILVLLIVSALPDRILRRFTTLVDSQVVSETDLEAIDSMNARGYLLRTSVEFTLRNPVFGIGPGQFSNYEGRIARESGRRGAWQVSHNSYTQISSEAGLPALALFLAAIGSTFLLLRRIYRRAREQPFLQDPEFQEIAHAANCLMLSLVTFGVAIFFLSLGYRFFMPALTGFAATLWMAADAIFARRSQPQPASAPAGSPTPPQVIGPASRPLDGRRAAPTGKR
jgi:O-antigen ligase